MEIRVVRYGHLFNLGNYENERLELEAYVQDGEDWEACYRALRATVLHAGKEGPEQEGRVEELDEEIERLERAADELKQRTAAAEERWKKATAFLARLGLEAPAWAYDDIPF